MKHLNRMECRLCLDATAVLLQEGSLLGDIPIAYYECTQCGYVQTDEPVWLDRAYASAIHDSDTGILLRNQANARIVLGTMFLLGKLDGRVVDYAGGYGILVRLLRDYGAEALWADCYCRNLLAQGFEYTDQVADLVTAFEAFEHFVNPAEELDKLLSIAPNILLSTEIIAEPAPKQDNWWYYGKDHGQHIGFFRLRTLEKLAKERGKFLLSDGHSYHLITAKYIPPLAWMMVLRLNKLIPFLLRHRLTSKTLVDSKNRISAIRGG